MKVLELSAYNPDPNEALRELKIAERPVPEPGPGQVLIKIQGAPCNPSDLLFLTGTYNIVKSLPCVPGFEGFGTIVKKGSGFFPWLKVGARVACGGQSDRDGTWAEYFLADAKSCLPLKKDVPDEQAPFMVVNPLTAMAMVVTAKDLGAKAIVQSAAASQLGQMVVRFAALEGIQTINVVRRDEQVQLIKLSGAKHVLNSSDPDFPAQLKAMSAELKATVALDAVSGDFTQHLVEQLPDGAHIILYGTLGGHYMDRIYSRAFSFGQKTLSGFNLKVWSDGQGMLKKLRMFGKAQKMVAAGEIRTDVAKVVGFEEAVAALVGYAGNMTAGKVVLRP